MNTYNRAVLPVFHLEDAMRTGVAVQVMPSEYVKLVDQHERCKLYFFALRQRFPSSRCRPEILWEVIFEYLFGLDDR